MKRNIIITFLIFCMFIFSIGTGCEVNAMNKSETYLTIENVIELNTTDYFTTEIKNESIEYLNDSSLDTSSNTIKISDTTETDTENEEISSDLISFAIKIAPLFIFIMFIMFLFKKKKYGALKLIGDVILFGGLFSLIYGVYSTFTNSNLSDDDFMSNGQRYMLMIFLGWIVFLIGIIIRVNAGHSKRNIKSNRDNYLDEHMRQSQRFVQEQQFIAHQNEQDFHQQMINDMNNHNNMNGF